MSAHLPECPEPECDQRCVDDCGHACICYALLACEARVLDEVLPDVRYAAYAAGVQAARDAVAALSVDAYCGDWCVDRVRDDALAAIDALRGQ